MGPTKEVVASNPLATLGRLREADGARETAGFMANDVGRNCLSEGSFILLAKAIGQIGEAIVITDAAAPIQYVNPAFTMITGYGANEVIGQNTRLLKSDCRDPAYY